MLGGVGVVNDPSKRRRVGEVIYSASLSWVGFQETKFSEVSVQTIGQLFGFQDVGFAFLSYVDLAGDLLFCWDYAHFFELSRVCQPKFVAIKGSWIAGEGLRGLIFLYAPTEYLERVVFFNSIISFVKNWDCIDFIIFGDFNSVL